MYEGAGIGLYEVLPPGAPQSFNVTCVMNWGGRSMILRHFNPSYTLNRTWVQYVDGFDHGLAATWIGLEKLYWLSRIQTFDLYIQFQKKGIPAEYVRMVYEKFEIGDSSTNYQLLSAQLNRARSPVNITDCLSDLIGSSFSSYDMDNNQVSGLDCPLKYGGAWWYNGACAQCNPTGNLYHTPGGNRTWADDEVFWEPFDWTSTSVSIWFGN
ncbi:hypothetical protein SNE40_012677 [Patella caerulea]|uniref:Fibrinogen C-terminal domain-containing protein n=1 Tax=Patella caerulea TaxID=87958 RepID=A0AAN8JS59_PATCE